MPGHEAFEQSRIRKSRNGPGREQPVKTPDWFSGKMPKIME
jgi:hypothetical protein